MSLRKTFIKTFDDNDCSPIIFKEMITTFRTLSNDSSVKVFLNKKQYQKEYKKDESERIKDFLCYIMSRYSTIYSETFSTSTHIIQLLNDVFGTGSYNKIIDSINRLFFPKEKNEDDDDILSDLISLMPMKYYGQKVKEMNYMCKESSKEYFKEITDNENSVCLTNGEKYVILLLNPDVKDKDHKKTEEEFDFDSSHWTLVKEHYYSFDSMKRSTDVKDILNMMLYLHLNTYMGVYKYNSDFQEMTDELKIRNNISSLPTKYEDSLGSLMCIFKYGNNVDKDTKDTKELKIYFTCVNIPSDINNDFTCEEIVNTKFIDEYFDRTNVNVLYSLG